MPNRHAVHHRCAGAGGAANSRQADQRRRFGELVPRTPGDVVAEDEPFEDLAAVCLGDLTQLQPAICVAWKRAVSRPDGGDDERCRVGGFRRSIGEQLEDFDDGVGRVGSVDDDDGVTAEIVVEDEDDHLGQRWAMHCRADDRQGGFSRTDGH